MYIKESELILNSNGSIYHLNILPEQIAENIILVGDQNRVSLVSSFFNSIEHKCENREFVTHTGYFNNKRVSVISTGIGTDNIDIVINELDALFNIDLKTKQIKSKKTSLNFVRIGTCGALHEYLGIENFILSKYALGLDNLIYYYKDFESILEKEAIIDFEKKSKINFANIKPYIVESNDIIYNKLNNNTFSGITITAPGFYGPQGRHLRLSPLSNTYNEDFARYNFNDFKITNFEMETSALYGLSKLLGHNAATICLIVANRDSKKFSNNYKPAMKKLILKTLQDLLS